MKYLYFASKCANVLCPDRLGTSQAHSYQYQARNMWRGGAGKKILE